MARRLLAAAAVVLIAAGAAGCSDDDEPSADEAVEESVTTGDTASPVVQVTDTPLGTILTDADGNTLYVFLEDEGTTSTCTGDCAEAWPPVEVSGAPVGTGVDAPLGTTTRDDGSEQLLVDGRPLYTFAGDDGPGATNGHGVNDVWYVVGADGTPVTPELETPSTVQGGRAGGY